ncbi:pyruvate, phosphate dikinase [Desulforhabdus amnigena]|jgi:pyruvate,orthophosphate dikinase|uniref:Pyruvate, phosphate dikinase n=1 Tax=Desulforhabdus amnigena TaxID=40218 RepID=A0A9W6L9R6_9BACT|nr:pyruvate, phosphate dikinase [Desulforhabdus amnigena]NLJ28186.1 pyruvate, phosphate dikinase [Deltaproteobacteria bacterium]GLI35729.1 pyruvate, phosphate dikinase [Desulforhabdus amnigena]
MAHKYVYFFGGGKADGNAQMKNLLGGKGANIAEMTNLGIPVPPGFTITTEICTYYYQNNQQYPPELKGQVEDALRRLEEMMGRKFGDPDNPLLVSVRSGAASSMPGMMDTVLNLGLNDQTVLGLMKETRDERFAYDCYRRFVAMYGDVVLGLKPVHKDEMDPFDQIIEEMRKRRKVEFDSELPASDLKELVERYKTLIRAHKDVVFPQDPMEQLWGAIGAVFGSWNNPRAIAYRELNNIPSDMGTAVNIQAMVFGNMGEDCGTGVGFTRNPATGENVFYGEYLINAQGEDVVAGIRTPQPINKAQKTDPNTLSLEETMPEIYQQLERVRTTLDRHYRDMQDIEFTIQKGKLWMLQTRTGKRTGFASFKIAVDMVREGIISKDEALMRVDPDQLNQLLRPIFDPRAKEEAVRNKALLAKGLNAGPGAATGRVVFNAPDAEEWAKRGEKVILVRLETSPEDIRGMHASQGILTARGGMTSHAALVGRQMGKVCVVGCNALEIEYRNHRMMVGDRIVREGDWLSLDGTTGEVFVGQIPTQPSEVLSVIIDKKMDSAKSQVYQDYMELLGWADECRRLGVWTNADQPNQVEVALAFGAEGIGLTRTEHMFFEGNRIDAVREMILADDVEGRKRALAKLLPMQKEDFKGIFRVMKGKPVTIRTLDPPLHEFLPHEDKDIQKLATEMLVHVERLKAKVESLHEANPMLGHRGCRLGIVYPEITAMQAQAIMEAACEVKKEGVDVQPEIMIPLVGHVSELKNQRKVVDDVAREVMERYGVSVNYRVGTMIEVPRGALTADEIAEVAEFFSFGTNDLTQTVFGISRDDAGKFLPDYLDARIWEYDPFEKLDQVGVGGLMEIAVKKGRATRPDLKIGICGEHGGEPSSVDFCHRIGLDYVSCSPYRVPVARLAAAQAAIRSKNKC